MFDRTIEDLADGLFGDVICTVRGGLEQIYTCVECGKDKLSVNIETGWFRCWKCEGVRGKVQSKAKYAGDIVEGRKLIAARKKVKEGGDDPIPLELIAAIPVRPGSNEYRYLTDVRGLDDDEIIHYDFRRSLLRKYRDQLVIPVTDGGYKGFQRRYLNPRGSIRYVNGKGFKRRENIYNFDRALDYPEIIICEGIFSAIAAGRNGVATFGKEVTKTQVRRLVSARRRLVVALDGGETLAELRLIVMIHAIGGKVDRIVLPNGKDPADDLDFQAILSETREEISSAWIMRQKIKISRMSVYGEIKIPSGFFAMLDRSC